MIYHKTNNVLNKGGEPGILKKKKKRVVSRVFFFFKKKKFPLEVIVNIMQLMSS